MATLYVVATPIGNLEDLSPRAARVLAQVELVAAESVGRTRKLLSHLGISGRKLISCREANRKRAAAQVRAHLDQGRDAALVSDAGTPGVSDPASLVVATAAAAGHRVSPIPGPSALAAALSVAGLPGAPSVFLGFLPAKPGPRRRLLAQARDTGWPVVVFEAPHRLAATARDLEEVFGDRPLVLARELSKVNEQVLHTTCGGLGKELEGRELKGEITLVVAGGRPGGAEAKEEDLDRLLAQGLERGDEPPSRLARRVAAATGLARERVYQRLLELKQGPVGQDHTDNEREDEMPQSAAEQEGEITLLVKNGLGLHARVAARIAETVQPYDCRVVLKKDQVEAEADSVLSILTLDAPEGSTLTASAQGPQAREALAALKDLFESRFGEES